MIFYGTVWGGTLNKDKNGTELNSLDVKQERSCLFDAYKYFM